MKKIIHPCDVPMVDGRKWSMFCKIEFHDGRLTISGVIGPNRHGNAKGSCGQIDMEFDHRNPDHNDSRYSSPIKANELRFSAGWDKSTWYTFLEYWHDWHLNDMHAECEHQESLGWTYNTHPCKPCPICGYKLGTARTMRDVPEHVISFLFSLPDTDKVPAWV